jgi:Sulfotransferase domain
MPLPNFLIIGAAKGGTTSLHHYLRQHPQIYLTPVKETNFFWTEATEHGRKTVQTLAEYERLFADANGARAVGEISPQYLNSATAAERIARDLPHVKLVVSLRHPADRAWSDYLGRVRILRERGTFDDAIRPGHTILEWGFYAPRLKRYYDRFPRQRIHVILYDDYAADPHGTLRSLFRFLDVDESVGVDTTTKHNPAAVPRSNVLNRILWPAVVAASSVTPKRWRGTGLLAKLMAKTYRKAPAFPPELRARLIDVYRDDILATQQLIGRDLSRWLT